MINRKHTAQTFRFYLGKEVLVVFPNGSNEMQVLTGRFYDDVIVDSLEYHKDYKVYPILKTVEQMSDKDICLLYNCLESDIERESNEEIFSDEEAFISGIRIWYRSSVEYEEYDYSYIFCDFTYSGSFEGITPKNMNFLIDNEYGAIPSTESHTGYVDLFGMPCVTRKQVEEGVFKHE